MNLINKIFKSKEAKAVLGVLDELGYKFDNNAYQMVRSVIEKSMEKYPESYIKLLKSGKSPREVVLTFVSNISGDFVESGRFHIYRGVLNDLSEGPDLLKLFDYSTDELQQIGAFTEDYANKQKLELRECIKQVG